jgi:hypothetical protein
MPDRQRRVANLPVWCGRERVPVKALVALLLAFLLAAPPFASAQQAEELRFRATILGLTAGRMVMRVNQGGGGDYAIAARTTSAGLAGLFRSFDVVNRVRGRESAGRFSPQRYTTQTEGAAADSGAEILWEAGVPQVIRMDQPNRPGAPRIDPAMMAGRVDPLTFTWALLRDIPADQACTLSLGIFDGYREAAARLSNPRPSDEGGVICDGVYSRVLGYPPEELAEQRDFTFRLRYRPLPDGRLRVAELELDSFFGLARFTRED